MSTMGSSIETINLTLNEEAHIDETHTYAQLEYGENFSIRPLLTLYRPETTAEIMSIKFPFAEDAEERKATLRMASWCSTFFPVIFFRLVIDSFVPLKDSEDMIDAILMVRFNSKVCEYKCLPYTTEGTELTWSDPAIVVDRDLLAEKEEILAFAAVNSFSKNDIPWASYKKYLESKGFEFIYHGSHNEDSITYYSRGLI